VLPQRRSSIRFVNIASGGGKRGLQLNGQPASRVPLSMAANLMGNSTQQSLARLAVAWLGMLEPMMHRLTGTIVASTRYPIKLRERR
jgi:hypothetical protein